MSSSVKPQGKHRQTRFVPQRGASICLESCPKQQARMRQNHVTEKQRRKPRYIRSCLNSGTSRSLMPFAALPPSLLRQLPAGGRKLSQSVVENLDFSFASHCSGSVTFKVSNSLLSTPQGQHHLKPTGGRRVSLHVQLQTPRKLGGGGRCAD